MPPKEADRSSEKPGGPPAHDNPSSSPFKPKDANPSQSLPSVCRGDSSGSTPARASLTKNRFIGELGIRISPLSSGATKGKEKRASKRLEEERKEIERRFRKIEEAELTKEATGLPRESRRLTKKQPIGRSSRSSSVSSDKSRSSITHLATLFSRSKNGARSRSSSTSRDDGRASIEWQSTEQTKSNSDSIAQPRVRRPSINVPERFGTAVSSKLALKNAVLLPLSVQQPDHTSTQFTNTRKPLESLDSVAAQNANSQDGNTFISQSPQRAQLNEKETPNDDALKLPSKEVPGTHQSLDRSSFSATLSGGNRDGGNSITPCTNTTKSPLTPKEEATRSESQSADSIFQPLSTPRLRNNDQARLDFTTLNGSSSSVKSKTPLNLGQSGSSKPPSRGEFIKTPITRGVHRWLSL